MSTLKPAIRSSDHVSGNANASVKLVEFGDFECPHCRRAHPLLARLLREKGDGFQLVFRHFPLQEIHPHAQITALAAEAAGKQGRFWAMHDALFDNQDRLSPNLLLDLAKELSLDLHRFGNDWKSEEGLSKIESDFESGIRSGVNGTPTFFLNGSVLHTYDGSYDSLAAAIAG